MLPKLLPMLVLFFGTAAFAAPMAGLTPEGEIAYFDSENPQVIFGQFIGDRSDGELLGIDTSPVTGELFAIGSTGRVFVISPLERRRSARGVLGATITGSYFGMDINPLLGDIRLISDRDQNLRFDHVSGAITNYDTILTPNGDKVGAAYDRNFSGATQTTLYVIDAATDTLETLGAIDGVPSPDGGLIFPIGPLGVDTSRVADLDIAANGSARALLTVGGESGIYAINLSTGAATLIGKTRVPITDISFVTGFPPIITNVPGLSWIGAIAVALILALSGSLLARRTS